MLSHQTSGNGKNLVLIHGFCETSTCYNKQVLLLKDHLKVTTIDLPGVKASALIPDLTMEKAADAIYEVLQSAGIKDCVMVGHSMGGYITLAYAKKYGSTLKGFGLLHSTATADNEERKAKRDQAVRVISEKGKDFYIEGFIPPLFSSKLKDKSLIEQTTKDSILNYSEGALEAFLTAMKNREDSMAFLKETKLPALFMIGKEDSIIPEMTMLEQATLAHVTKVVYMENSGHMGMMEEPETCAKGLSVFTEYCYSQAR